MSGLEPLFVLLRCSKEVQVPLAVALAVVLAVVAAVGLAVGLAVAAAEQDFSSALGFETEQSRLFNCGAFLLFASTP
jgi:hypothetical protein